MFISFYFNIQTYFDRLDFNKIIFYVDMVHLSCRGKSTPEEDFEGVTKLLFQPTNTSGAY